MSRENWWLDYVEGELDVVTRAEMKALLKCSRADQEIVEALTSTKELLKDHEPPARMPADDVFFEALHDKIMMSVEETVIQPAPRMAKRMKKMMKRLVISSGGMAALAVLVLSVGALSDSAGQKAETAIQPEILQAAAQNPDESFQVLGVQSQDDFLVDVASSSFDDLSIQQLEGLLKTR
jgi:anti-sigma factor RsiW